MFQIIKFREVNGRQIKRIFCLDGEFHDECYVDVKVGVTRRTWKTIGGADRWLAERSEMAKYAKVQRI